jgi:hypothetical protein
MITLSAAEALLRGGAMLQQTFLKSPDWGHRVVGLVGGLAEMAVGITGEATFSLGRELQLEGGQRLLVSVAAAYGLHASVFRVVVSACKWALVSLERQPAQAATFAAAWPPQQAAFFWQAIREVLQFLPHAARFMSGLMLHIEDEPSCFRWVVRTPAGPRQWWFSLMALDVPRVWAKNS